ncbi:AAA family ATPase [Streptomyces netropsis]|uniref:helix-turn-helix transcriptional regulator n=1 Tax=Streptomyces netropsis TaxID=55404 RepID=UPI003789D8AC
MSYSRDEKPERRPPAAGSAEASARLVEGELVERELVEREEEQKLLTGLLRGLRSGRSAAVEVRGAPGSGRSALLCRAAELADRAGVTVATAQASWEESGLRYGVVAQLLAALAPATGAGHAPHRSGDESADRASELCRVFLSAAREHPLLLVVDDVQWADPYSRRWLQALARRLDSAPLMLLTARSDALPGGPYDRIELCPLADAPAVTGHTLPLAPLSAAGVGAMLEGSFTEPADPAFVRAASRAVEGNPAVLRAVIGRFAGHGWAPAADRLPQLTEAAAEAARDRAVRTFSVLPEELLGVLRVVAVAGRHCTPEMITALAELRTLGAARALELLSGTGLLTAGDRPAFGEPKAAEAALAGIGAERREELYARVADWAHRTAVPDGGLARMLLGARVIGHPWAVEVLRREAARRRAAGHPEEAVRLLRRALREPVRPPLRVRILIELSTVVLPTSPEAADRHLRQALLVAPADGSVGPSWVRAAELLVARGDVAAAQPLIAQAAARSETRPADRAALRALYWLAEHSQQGATHELDQPRMTALPTSPTEPAEAGVVAWRGALGGHDITRARALARTALAPSARDTTPLTTQLAACHTLVLADDFAEARTALDAVLVRAEESDARGVTGLALLVDAMAELRQGRPDRAATALDRARETVPQHCWHPLMAPGPAALRALVQLEREDLEGAERSVALARPGGAEGGLAWAHLLYARGRLRLALGHRGKALADFLECGRLLLARQVTNPALLPWRSAAAQARGPRPDDAQAIALLAEERRLALAWGAPSGVTTALHTMGVRAADPARHGLRPGRPWPEPAAPAPRTPVTWQYRQALLALGTTPLNGSDTIDALLLGDAPATERTGRTGPTRQTGQGEQGEGTGQGGRSAPARPRRAPAGTPPTSDGAPPPASLGLTGAELRVAALAAGGLANRAIAAELSVTLRTVELHLTKAYRKLGISGRAELAAALGRAPRETP